MHTKTKALSSALYGLSEATNSKLARDAAEQLDVQIVAINTLRRDLGDMVNVIETLINEPQPLGIERQAYQAALKVVGLNDKYAAPPPDAYAIDTGTWRARVQGATYGEWKHVFCDKSELREMIKQDGIRVVADCTWGAPPGVCQVVYAAEDCGAYDSSNAEFIAAANPVAIVALLDEIDGLRQKLANCISLNSSDK